MNTVLKHIALAAALFCAAASCRKESGMPVETATVNLIFKTGASGQQPISSKAGENGPNEGIKTLRVIVGSNDGGQLDILKNYKETYNDNSTVKHLTIYDVPVGEWTFYVIANEESLGMEYTDENIQNNLDMSLAEPKLHHYDNDRFHFPKTSQEIGTNGLPISGKKTITVAKGMKPVTIQMKRAVCKVNLTIENAMASDIVLKQVAFGQFCADALYLFDEASLYNPIPADVEYYPATFGTGSRPIDLPIAAQESPTLTFYFYPSFAYRAGDTSYPYTLSLVSDKKTWPSTSFLNFEEPGKPVQHGNSIDRNVQINVKARLNSDASIDVNFKVTDWTDAEVEVPPFN